MARISSLTEFGRLLAPLPAAVRGHYFAAGILTHEFWSCKALKACLKKNRKSWFLSAERVRKKASRLNNYLFAFKLSAAVKEETGGEQQNNLLARDLASKLCCCEAAVCFIIASVSQLVGRGPKVGRGAVKMRLVDSTYPIPYSLQVLPIREPGGNRCGHKENMQTPHRKGPMPRTEPTTLML